MTGPLYIKPIESCQHDSRSAAAVAPLAARPGVGTPRPLPLERTASPHPLAPARMLPAVSARRGFPWVVALLLMAVAPSLPASAHPASPAPASAFPAQVAGSPIRPDNSPTPLAGQTNGQVAPSQLIEVEPNCLAAR